MKSVSLLLLTIGDDTRDKSYCARLFWVSGWVLFVSRWKKLTMKGYGRQGKYRSYKSSISRRANKFLYGVAGAGWGAAEGGLRGGFNGALAGVGPGYASGSGHFKRNVQFRKSDFKRRLGSNVTKVGSNPGHVFGSNPGSRRPAAGQVSKKSLVKGWSWGGKAAQHHYKNH